LKEKIRVAHIAKTSNVFMNGNHFDNTSYYFHMKALKRNPRLELKYFDAEKIFNASKLKGKFDIIILADNLGLGIPKEIIGLKNLAIPIISRCGDFHNAKKYNPIECHEKYNIDYYFNFMSEKYFYKFYPKKYKYKSIIFGLEPSLYSNLTPFKDRIKDKILNSGAIGKKTVLSRVANQILNPKRSGWYFYKLRTMCNELPYVEHFGMIGKKFTNDSYQELLSRYKGAIAATTFYPTIKYWEIPAAGCLTFMEITEENDGVYLGYKDEETAIFVNEKNYKQKFEMFLADPNNTKWQDIANAGRKYALNELNNDKAVEKLIRVMEELIK
jgi:hypothetical protein